METTNLLELADAHGLETIETTQGRNGYPSGTGYAITGFNSWLELKQFAEEHDLEITQFHSKDGWHFWESKRRMYEPIKNSAEDYGDNYSEIPKIDEEDFIKNEVQWFFEDPKESFEQIEEILKQKKEIWEEVEQMEDDEIVITHEGRYYETIKKESLYWSHDTHNYCIGLVSE